MRETGAGEEIPWDLLARIPSLDGAAFEVVPLPGGLTNRNYRLTGPALDVVVRVSDPTTSLLAVDRQAEYENSLIAAAVGVGAPVVDYLPGAGVLVVGYLPSRTFTESDVAAHLPQVAQAVRDLHAAAPFANRFDFFALHEHYLRIMDSHGFRMPPGYLDLEPHAARMRAAFAAIPQPLVSCHNDLLAGNFLDDGQAVRIIDYEYSGCNEASFELGNIAQESHLQTDELSALVTAYLGADDAVAQRWIARAELWAIMSAYGWTLWGTIQQGASDLDEDFWGWAMEKYDRAREAIARPEFDRLLDRVGGRP